MNEFESGIVGYLQDADDLTPSEKKLKRFFEKNPDGMFRRRVLKRLKGHADVTLKDDAQNGGVMFANRGYDEFKAIDWKKLIEMLGPLLKLIISLFL